MERWISTIAMLIRPVGAGRATPAAPLAPLYAVRAQRDDEARQGLPVAFEAMATGHRG